ncbi:hypothetical protein VFPPC_06892 [Pochonia chlamydosporia 170]|uniref:Phospholipase A2 n=1 Tax=Pochonia chlamydosporia 170 TaxID=1380566 RepID=A0A179FAJ2_METCM|nr:hypothetical protein VFPPC_06892 [Pochonia chlamydosporia 170]OAQ62484.2 hypothetical protein VFPPC_06892 [Pochonia chlamydosporia 170]
MKLTLWVLITLAAVSGASPGNKSPSSRSLARREDSKCTDAGKIRETDRLLFSESIETFIKTRDTKNPSCLDWSSDACSSSPDGVLGLYDFTWSCMRHDFGYRNAKAQKRCTHSLRQRIDDNFWGDMMRYCDDNFHWYSWFNKQACKGAADSYYQAVRDHGRDACGPAISKAVLILVIAVLKQTGAETQLTIAGPDG